MSLNPAPSNHEDQPVNDTGPVMPDDEAAEEVAESAAERLLSLPMYPELTEEQIEYVCSSIKEFVEI